MLNKKGLVPSPVTLGEHLRNRRLSLELRQEDVADQLGTLREVYERWERDERAPVISEWPGMLAFLGYYPATETTPADLVVKARRCQGMDQKRLAQSVGVIHQKLRRWEHSKETPSADQVEALQILATVPLQLRSAPDYRNYSCKQSASRRADEVFSRNRNSPD